MQKALQLAGLAQGRTSPNPLVGAVVVKDGLIIGEGYHHRAGSPHAEVLAIREAGEKARGAVLYVSLEPCNHHGRTPPCTEAIIAAGIERVYIGVLDPNPRVAGSGVNRLREAGIDVQLGCMEQEAQALNECYFKFITWGMPFVALKTATTLDGKIATYTGDSQWITNEKSREYVHGLRDIFDAIMVGSGTVLKDNPRLNTRLAKEDVHHPVRLIVDGRLEIPCDCNIMETTEQQTTIIYSSFRADSVKKRKLEDSGAEVVLIGQDPDKLPLEDILRDAAARGLMSVLIEAGGQINAYVLENHLVDKVYWFIAPRICGGDRALSAVGGQGIALMNQTIDLHNVEVHSFDGDLMIEGYIKPNICE